MRMGKFKIKRWRDCTVVFKLFFSVTLCMVFLFGFNWLLNNMVLLGALGWNLEAVTGKARFLAIYFGSGLAGNLLSLFFNRASGENVVSAGASGAIFGLMGALLYVVIINRGRLGRLTGRGMLFMAALSSTPTASQLA